MGKYRTKGSCLLGAFTSMFKRKTTLYKVEDIKILIFQGKIDFFLPNERQKQKNTIFAVHE